MKKVLITGANSYIGTRFETYIKENYPNDFTVDTLDMIDGSWRKFDFAKYDTVFHVAGIAHSDVGKVTDNVKSKYYAVNTELTIETAKKAKECGVGQFIFMSSMIVYGIAEEYITKETEPNPDNFYGDSKLRADIEIHKLADKTFNVVSLRPPMIYGKGSKGNYPILSKFARSAPVFPSYKNKRSMLYVENLCNFIKLMIDNNENGYFYPQNKEYVATSNLVKKISDISEKNLLLTGVFNPFIRLAKNNSYIRKIFGNRCYDMNMSNYKNFEYCMYDFDESIKRTEGN